MLPTIRDLDDLIQYYLKLSACVRSPFLIQPSEQVCNNYSDKYDMSHSDWMQI